MIKTKLHIKINKPSSAYITGLKHCQWSIRVLSILFMMKPLNFLLKYIISFIIIKFICMHEIGEIAFKVCAHMKVVKCQK